jgi:hypothetical protein
VLKSLKEERTRMFDYCMPYISLPSKSDTLHISLYFCAQCVLCMPYISLPSKSGTLCISLYFCVQCVLCMPALQVHPSVLIPPDALHPLFHIFLYSTDACVPHIAISLAANFTYITSI